MFASPVGRFIRPLGSPRIVGDPHVVRDCAGHQATKQGCALDIGFGRCGDPVVAMLAGRVRPRTPSMVLQGIVRIDHAGGSWAEYVHMNGVLVKVGDVVAQGQQIGVVGDAHDPSVTNFAGCHLHVAVHLSAVGPEVDLWPLLDQNQEADTNTTITVYPAPRTWATKGGLLTGYRNSPAPLTKSVNFAAGSPALADAEVTIDSVPGNWPAGPYQRVTNGPFTGYLLANSQIALSPVPTPDCAAAVNAATDPLNAQIAQLNADLAAANGKIAKAQADLA
jgi:hypothetical protein